MIKKLDKRLSLKTAILPSLFYLSISGLILFMLYPFLHYVKKDVIVALSVIGLWRYSFQIINYIRAIIYRLYKYPILKREISQLKKEGKYPEHIYFLIPSYREEPWVSIESFQSIFSDMNNIPSKATLLVSVGSAREEAIIRTIYESHPTNQKIDIIFQLQSKGKRYAMGHGLRAISRDYHKRGLYEKNSVVIFMDGDSYLEPGTLEKCLPVFKVRQKVGAVTTNEMSFINTKSNWYKDWFSLKFGQRHILFQSHSLSDKVITLTGRFSVFRLDICLEEDFIKQIEDDILTNPMTGRFRFLMGDDKSSWFYLFKKGWDMLYIPDSIIYTLESRDDHFLNLSFSLPFRWYGNTLRNNDRAVKIKNISPFINYVIRDQVFNMWTSLVGISAASILAIFVNPIYLPIYISWVLFIKVIQQNVIAAMGYPVTINSIPLMLYSQWVGSFVKIYAYFHLNKQTYNKSGSTQKLKNYGRINHPWFDHFGLFRMFTVVLAFYLSLFLVSNATEVPNLKFFKSMDKKSNIIYVKKDHKKMASYINNLIENSDDNITILLPMGNVYIKSPILITRSNIKIIGNQTTIIYSFKKKESAAIFIKGSLNNKKIKKIKKDTYYLMEQSNDKDLLKDLGSKVWNKKYPYIRKDIKFNENEIKTKFTKKVRYRKLNMIKNVTLKNFTIKGDEDTSEYSYIYKNINKRKIASSIKVKYAANINIEDINILNSYSHTIDLDTVYNISVKRIYADGSLNKGKGGNGYFKVSRTFNSKFEGITLLNLRHLTIQWSSAYNVFDGINLYNTDLNFHGGGTHHNLIKNIEFYVSKKDHKWGNIFNTPNNAKWAPPDYKNNIVLK